MQGFSLSKDGTYAPNKNAAWVGFDLDGTLAHHGQDDGVDGVGEPVPMMLQRLKLYLSRGVRVKIVTARVASTNIDRYDQVKMVQAWLERQGQPPLEVVAEKDYLMLYLYDDRARQVIPNTGVVVGELTGLDDDY